MVQKYDIKEFVNMMENGVIVNLHIHAFRGKRTLKKEDIYTPDQEKFISDFIALGMKYVLPKGIVNKISSIETQARKFLNYKSFPTLWGHFVPFTVFEQVVEKLNKYKVEYETMIESEIMKNYNDIIKRVKEKYVVHYTDVFMKREKRRPSRYEIENFINTLRIPSKDDLKYRYSFDWEYGIVPVSHLEEFAESKDDQLEKEKKKVKNEDELKSLVEKHEKIRNMNKEVIRKVRESKEKMMNKFVNTVFYKLKITLHDVLNGVKESLVNGKKLHPRKKLHLKNLVKYIKEMNFMDDEKIDKIVNELDVELVGTVDTKSLEKLCGNVTEILDLELANLKQEDRWISQKKL